MLVMFIYVYLCLFMFYLCMQVFFIFVWWGWVPMSFLTNAIKEIQRDRHTTDTAYSILTLMNPEQRNSEKEGDIVNEQKHNEREIVEQGEEESEHEQHHT